MLGEKASASQFSLMHAPTRSVILLGVTQESRDMAQITMEAGASLGCPGPTPAAEPPWLRPTSPVQSSSFPVVTSHRHFLLLITYSPD